IAVYCSGMPLSLPKRAWIRGDSECAMGWPNTAKLPAPVSLIPHLCDCTFAYSRSFGNRSHMPVGIDIHDDARHAEVFQRYGLELREANRADRLRERRSVARGECKPRPCVRNALTCAQNALHDLRPGKHGAILQWRVARGRGLHDGVGVHAETPAPFRRVDVNAATVR